MKRSPLVQKTPLKAKTKLTAKTPLKSKTTLRSTTRLRCKQKTARKLDTPYKTIFGSMDTCYITGSKNSVVPHHIFGGPNKAKSEEYGFILPLRKDWHTMQPYSIHEDRNLDLKYKRLCQEYWLNTICRTKEEFISEFKIWY